MASFSVALFLVDRLNNYQALIQSDCERVARRHDLQLTVYGAERNVDLQVSQIRSVLAEKEASRPRAVLVCPVSEVALMPLIHDAARLGIAWAFLSRWNDGIHDLRRQYPKVPIFAVVPDHLEIGHIQGQQLRILLNPGDEVVCIHGPIGTYSTRRRWAGLEQELAQKRDTRVSCVNGDWSERGGESAMQSWLTTFTKRKLPPFVIAAQNDNMAVGARGALADWEAAAGQAPRPELKVIGCDGSPGYGQRLVTSQQLTATVIVPPVASLALDEIVTAFRHGRLPAAETTVPVRSHPDLDGLAHDRRRSASSKGRT
jgi:ribose transport system substrate-binding protein